MPGSAGGVAHRWRRLPGHKLAMALMVVTVCALPCAAQQPQHANGNQLSQSTIPYFMRPPFPPNWAGGHAGNHTNPRFTPKQLELMNDERQKSLVADTNKLLKLAKELNAEVNGDQAGKLTQDQLRKVHEIQKLAHKVKNEMSFGPGGGRNMGPSMFPPLFPPMIP